jgi:hypothetical protein
MAVNRRQQGQPRRRDIIIDDNGGESRSIFNECQYLNFSPGEWVWHQYHLCYGQSSYGTMADGADTFRIGDLVGPQTSGTPKVLVLYFMTPW